MYILVVDGQGGRLGKELVEKISAVYPDDEIVGVGTNSAATASLVKGGCNAVATGENAICVCARKADVIVGPLGIVVADSLMGEISSKAACAVGASDAVKILIPVGKCANFVAGVGNATVSSLIDDAVRLVGEAKKTLDGKASGSV